MDWAVLVKVIPPVEQLAFDPVRRTMVREGASLIQNPFDRRAIQLALNLRRSGEALTVLSMGPAASDGPLREAAAIGVDRVIRITDPALAGSDTLITARVLTRALERIGHHVIVGGRWSVDAETGQVGPEVAALLGVPVVTAARDVVRESDGALVVTSSTSRGWTKTRCPPPVLLTVGEDVVRVRRPTPEELARSEGTAIEVWTGADLGFHEAEVGLGASPTVVTGLRNDAPLRRPTIWEEGDGTARAQRAAQDIGARVRGSRRASADAIPPWSGPLRDDREVLVWATDGSGRLDEDALPLFGAVRVLLPGFWPSAIWVGDVPAMQDRRRFAATGAFRAYHLRSRQREVESGAAAMAAREVVSRRSRAAVVLFPANAYGVEVAAQCAAPLGAGLVGDVVGMGLGDGQQVVWQKPSFGGGIIATIETRTRPSFATARPGAFGPYGALAGTADGIEIEELPWVHPEPSTQSLGRGDEVEGRWGDLATARVVFTVGMGVGGPEGVRGLLPWAERLGAAVGATRRVADAGWLPRQLQVGLTGRSIAPDLAVLVGVSGATNHLIGLRRARVVCALNPDRQAPVFQSVDVGVVGPWQETLPPLVEALERELAANPG